MFVYWAFRDQGSAQDIRGYSETARALGHEVVVYGPPNAHIPLNYSLDVSSADALIFIVEWTTELQYGDRVELERLLQMVPRERRVVIDCDGNYNDLIHVPGDYNHLDAAASRRWVEACDSVSDKICQPTLRPLRPNVRPFLFHAYDPAWERPLDFRTKDFGMIYLGNTGSRWWPMHRVLRAIEPIRERVGRMGLVGHGWDALERSAAGELSEPKRYVDQDYLRKLDVEIFPAVPFGQVIEWMGRGRFNPVIYRPLFSYLRLATCRTFETPAANTIPLFGLDEAHVREIYGDRAVGLILDDEHPSEKILDIVERPGHYAEMVLDIRRHLAEKHSYAARLRELIEIVES